MPIVVSTPIRCVSQDEFHALDRVMLGHAFKIHNQYGRLLDESVYKALLVERCAGDGLTSLREVAVKVSHGTFSKTYFIDLLLDGSIVVEVKTAKTLATAHRGQGINYLLLTDTRHGSLVNFRSFKVEREFLSTTLTTTDRQSFQIKRLNWPEDKLHTELRTQIETMCADIGLGLDVTLYREALAALLSLPCRLVPVLSGPSPVGHHEMSMLSADHALAVTSLSRLSEHRRHLERLLSNTPLHGLTWVNLTLGEIHLEHISLSKN